MGPEASLFDFDPRQIGDNLLRIGLACLLAMPLGLQRESGSASAGLRTFPVVAMAACGFALIARSLPDATAETQARLLQGLIAGIGFIGGGAIVRNSGEVHGIVTAASIWATGAIGASVAYGRLEVAVALTVTTLIALVVLTPIRRRLDDD